MLCSMIRQAAAMVERLKRGKVIAIAMNDLLNDAELAQAPKIAREAGRRNLAREGSEVGTVDATDVDFGTLMRAQQGLLSSVEKFEALEGMAIDRLTAGQPMEVDVFGSGFTGLGIRGL